MEDLRSTCGAVGSSVAGASPSGAVGSTSDIVFSLLSLSAVVIIKRQKGRKAEKRKSQQSRFSLGAKRL